MIEVIRFAAVMEEKLIANSHKGGWDGLSNRYLLRRLRTEVRELERELDCPFPKPKKIAKECADIANFAMMIADNSGGLT